MLLRCSPFKACPPIFFFVRGPASVADSLRRAQSIFHHPFILPASAFQGRRREEEGGRHFIRRDTEVYVKNFAIFQQGAGLKEGNLQPPRFIGVWRFGGTNGRRCEAEKRRLQSDK